MKNLLKNIALSLVLTCALLALAACTKTTTGSTQPSVGNSGISDALKGGDYPPAPASIMQAEIKDVDGNTFKLENEKGKVVLVNLWGIWCGPCVAEMPHLIEMQNEFKDKNFEIIGLNVGDEDGGVESAENIKAFAEKKNINYRLGFADEKMFAEMAKLSRTAAVPLTIVLNREGKLTGVFTGGGARISAQMRETVEKFVNQ